MKKSGDFWFTTKTGKKVHVLEGETPKEATKRAIAELKAKTGGAREYRANMCYDDILAMPKSFEDEYGLEDLTDLESDVIITSRSIQQAFGDKARELQEAIRNADPILAKAFEKHQNQLKIIDAHYKKTGDNYYHFDREKGGIFFDIAEDSLPSDNRRKKFSTYFHETGHNLDWVIGKKLGLKGYASGGYKSPTYQCTFNQMIRDESTEFIELYRKICSKKTGNIVVPNEEVYKEIFISFKKERLVNKRQLSDILDGITNGKMRESGYCLGASHTKFKKDYWTKKPVGREAFAHFTSILGSNSQMKEMYAKIFPKSFEIYKEILEL